MARRVNKAGYAVTTLRANVLDLLPRQNDAQGNWTGKYKVNGAHTVSLRETSGNAAIQSAGGTIFLVYKNLSEPLRKVVVYDGISTAYDNVNPNPEGTPLTQDDRRFLPEGPDRDGAIPPACRHWRE